MVTPFSLTSKVVYLIHSFPVLEKKIKNQNIGPDPILLYPFGFFYGVAAEKQGGAGVLLAISRVHSFHIKLGCSVSTNMRAELLALWVLLYWDHALGLPSLHIFGDS